MKKFLLLLLLCLPSFAAITGSMQWDVRTGGADTNGGGFDPTVASPGTDFSLQNAAQISYTDLIIGATTTQFTSVLHPNDSTLPGNVINITGGSGCTTGWFEIFSESGITATADRSLGTAASTCTAKLGGSLLTVGQAITNATTNGTPGETINIKAGTYTRTTALTVATGGALTFIGYNATHGDGGTKPLLTTATDNVSIVSGSGLAVDDLTVFDNISFSSTATTPQNGLRAGSASGWANVVVRNCKFSGFNQAIYGDWNVVWTFLGLTVINSEFANNVIGINHSAGITVLNSYFHANSTAGILISAVSINSSPGSLFVSRTIFAGNGIGFSDEQTAAAQDRVIINNTITGSTMDGMFFKDTNTRCGAQNCALTVINNILYNNGGYGMNLNSVASPYNGFPVGAGIDYNGVGSNTSGNYHNQSAGAHDVTLSADPFTNSGGGDYSLNAITGGGAALKTVGAPGSFPGLSSTTTNIDIGAVQTASSVGSSCSSACVTIYH